MMMKSLNLPGRAVPLLLAACFFMVLPTAFAQAAQNTSQDSEKPAKKKKSSQSKNPNKLPGKVTFLPNSQESTGERNARLKRECKGRVNAGACAGFTQ